MELHRIGTVRVKPDRRCDICGGAPDAALRDDQLYVFCWPCLRRLTTGSTDIRESLEHAPSE